MTGQRDSMAALTLFEMLVVLAVIGVAAGAALMGTSVLTRDNRVRDEAASLAARLQVAADEALTGGQRIEMEWTASGYGFRRWRGEDAGWGLAVDARLGTGRSLPGDVVLSRVDGLSDPVGIAPDGMAPAVTMRLRGPDAVWTVAFDGLRAEAMPYGAAP